MTMTVENPRALTIGRHRTLAETAYDEMMRLIREGTWPTRMRLPSELELAKQFSMSRPVIRQALARLRQEGVIQSRQGSGSFVREVEPAPASEPRVQFPTISSLADLDAFLNFREGLEVEAAATAARRHTEVQVQEMADAAGRVARGTSDSSVPMSDYAFHLAVAAASNNSFYANTLASLREHMLIGLNLEWSFSGTQPEFRNTVAIQHQAIIDAIASRSPERARSAMREHLQWARSKLVSGGGVLEGK
jgi:GntR family transcriptional regulator, transcriptional repressor for pyruvate dehydrogenase complex